MAGRLLALWVAVAMLAGCTPADVLNGLTPDGGVTVTRNIPYAAGDRHGLDFYAPTGGGRRATLVFFYGGAWRSGSKRIYGFLGNTLARAGFGVVVPDYRLYPAVQYPAFLEDGAAAVAFVQAHPERFGAHVFLMGHSAGAYIAAMLALDGRYLAAAGGDAARLCGLIGLAGPYDFLPMTGDTREVFGAAADDPATQPVAYARRGTVRALLLAGAADWTVKPRNTVALAARLGAETRFYAGIGHVGLVLAVAPLFAWRAPVLRDVTAFVAGAPGGCR